MIAMNFVFTAAVSLTSFWQTNCVIFSDMTVSVKTASVTKTDD